MVCDAVYVSSWDRAVVGVVGVDGVECGIVVAEDDIALYAVFVRDNEVRNAGCVGDEFRFDSWGREGVFAISSGRRDSC